MEKSELKSVIEAVIFAADHAITFEKLMGVFEGQEREDVRVALKELIADYIERSGGIVIEEVAGGFQLRTRPEHAPWLKRFFKVGIQRVSKAALETLSIVAYKQPLTRAGLEEIRGVDSAGVLKTLLERRLVRIVGRQDAPGRPVVYGTTKEFLETFSLSDLASLPTLKEIETLEQESVGEEYELLSLVAKGATQGVNQGAGEEVEVEPGSMEDVTEETSEEIEADSDADCAEAETAEPEEVSSEADTDSDDPDESNDTSEPESGQGPESGQEQEEVCEQDEANEEDDDEEIGT